jgi:hypothetical protein
MLKTRNFHIEHDPNVGLALAPNNWLKSRSGQILLVHSKNPVGMAAELELLVGELQDLAGQLLAPARQAKPKPKTKPEPPAPADPDLDRE